MAQKAVFADQAEQFALVVNALLQNKQTRTAFAKDPLATLKQNGIEFADPAVAKRVETELVAFAGNASMPGPDDDWPPHFWIQAMSITWVAKPGEIDNVITSDRIRVNAFVTQTAQQNTITKLEKRIAMLEANR